MGSPKVSTEETGRKAATEFLEAVECGGCVDKYIQVFYYNMIIFYRTWKRMLIIMLNVVKMLIYFSKCFLNVRIRIIRLNVGRMLIFTLIAVRMLIIMLNVLRMLIIMLTAMLID